LVGIEWNNGTMEFFSFESLRRKFFKNESAITGSSSETERNDYLLESENRESNVPNYEMKFETPRELDSMPEPIRTNLNLSKEADVVITKMNLEPTTDGSDSPLSHESSTMRDLVNLKTDQGTLPKSISPIEVKVTFICF
jgi:hypothetical protein